MSGRRIVCAANKYPDGTIVLGVRHFDPLMRASIEQRLFDLSQCGREVQGFVDNRGQFHDRRTAWKIAVAANQVVERCGGDETGILYSENLY